MTRELGDLILSLFRSPADDSVYYEAQSRREEIVDYLRRPEALSLLDRLPEEGSREQLGLVFALYAGLSERKMAENVVLKEARDTVEAKLCDAFNEVLLKGLPDDLRDLGYRLEQAGARRIDPADLEYLREEPVLAQALAEHPSWHGWEEWGVTPLSLHSAMQAISVLARKRSPCFENVSLLGTGLGDGEHAITPDEATRAITRATDWSPEVARVVYDWLLETAHHVSGLFEHFEATSEVPGKVILRPLTLTAGSRADPGRFAARWAAKRLDDIRPPPEFIYDAGPPDDTRRSTERWKSVEGLAESPAVYQASQDELSGPGEFAAVRRPSGREATFELSSRAPAPPDQRSGFLKRRFLFDPSGIPWGAACVIFAIIISVGLAINFRDTFIDGTSLLASITITTASDLAGYVASALAER